MSRIRTIKPEFWSSKPLAKVSRDARLTFIGLWGMCDDVGVMLDAPKTIAGELFPHDDDIGNAEVNRFLTELANGGFILRVSENGKDYIIIHSWDEHQKIDKPSKHRWISREERDLLSDSSRETRETPSVGKGKGKGTEEREDFECSLRSHSSLPDEPADDGDQSSDPVELKAKRQKPEDTELILDLVDEWNAEAARLGLPQVLDISSKRQSALRARIRDFPTFGYENPKSGFRALLAKIRGSPFLLGQTQANFRADFDFVTRQSSFLKIMEGNYEAKNKTFAGTR